MKLLQLETSASLLLKLNSKNNSKTTSNDEINEYNTLYQEMLNWEVPSSVENNIILKYCQSGSTSSSICNGNGKTILKISISPMKKRRNNSKNSKNYEEAIHFINSIAAKERLMSIILPHVSNFGGQLLRTSSESSTSHQQNVYFYFPSDDTCLIDYYNNRKKNTIRIHSQHHEHKMKIQNEIDRNIYSARNCLQRAMSAKKSILNE